MFLDSGGVYPVELSLCGLSSGCELAVQLEEGRATWLPVVLYWLGAWNLGAVSVYAKADW